MKGIQMKTVLKKIFILLALLFVNFSNAFAVNMVQKEDVLKRILFFAGLSDFPPFSYYEKEVGGIYTLHSAFLKPLKDAFSSYSFTMKPYDLKDEQYTNPKLFMIAVKSGEINFFIGAMSDTKLFSGLELIYPASVSNPVHIITTGEGSDRIKSTADLQNLKGIVCTQEYFSDFVLRKIKGLNIEYVEQPYDAYEKLFTGEADYMIGSAYFNRIMSSRYGINRYLSYSKTPIFKIPMFIAISRLTPVWEEYAKVFREEFSKPSFGNAVKSEILRMITEEEQKNEGIVPPAFARHLEEEETPQEAVSEEEQPANDLAGRIVEQKVEEKTFDEVLDGI